MRTHSQPLVCLSILLANLCPANELWINGRIVTGDDAGRVAEALWVRDGRIAALGAAADVRPAAETAGAVVIDLGGRMILPGMIESHCHSIGASRAALAGDYAEFYSIADVQAWIRQKAATLPAGTWIETPRNEITRLKERRFPTPEELDAATTEHPVLFVSVTKSVLNSAGWKLLGVSDESFTVSGGEVEFDKGRPVLMRGGQAVLRSLMPVTEAPSPQALRAKLREVFGVYNSVGITTLFERATDRAGFDLFRELGAAGELTARVRGTFRFSAKSAADVENYVAKLGLQPGEGDDLVRATCMKITVDGGIHWGTTWLSEPHGERRTAFYRNTDPAYQGNQGYSEELMREIYGTVNRLGWPMSAHVTGDGGAMAVLRAVAAVAAEQPDMLERRFNLIHCYFPDPAMAALAKQVNAGVDTQGYLYYRDADFISTVYGQDWAERFIGLGEWVKAGVPVGLNSDHMVGLDPNHAMNAFNPFLMLWIAVSRLDDHGNVHGPHQKLSRLDALRCLTIWPAWLSFDEDLIGSLEPGKLADFIVIDRDYLDCPEEEIRHIQVQRTVLGGKTVFER